MAADKRNDEPDLSLVSTGELLTEIARRVHGIACIYYTTPDAVQKLNARGPTGNDLFMYTSHMNAKQTLRTLQIAVKCLKNGCERTPYKPGDYLL